jgi:ABC-type Fe3+-citrate transport system substrate-binding protein
MKKIAINLITLLLMVIAVGCGNGNGNENITKEDLQKMTGLLR